MYRRRFALLHRLRGELLTAFVSADCVRQQNDFRQRLERVCHLIDVLIGKSLERAYRKGSPQWGSLRA